MVVNAINPRNRTYRERERERERFQCLLQRIAFEAGIGDVYLKFLSMLPFLSRWYTSSFVIAAASVIFFYTIFSWCQRYFAFLLPYNALINIKFKWLCKWQTVFSTHVLYLYIFLSLLSLLLCWKTQNGKNVIYISCVKVNNNIVQ